MKSKLYYTFLLGFLLGFLILGCSEKNECLKSWPRGYEKTPALYKDSIFNDCSFIVKGDFKISDSIESIKQRARISDKKFYIQPLDIDADEFIFLDFDNQKNSTRTIKIKCANITKSYESVLEDIVIIKENIKVRIFRIKKLAKLSNFFGGAELDVVLFATEEHGVIGSYVNDKTGDKNLILGERGDILRDYIDYSNFEFGELL